jgi:long-chain acyl-CoA synthetase
VISDLALASHSIPSFTLASSNLLASVLESHPPSAVITHASMLTQILELIYDAGEANRNHIIVVVGEPSPQAMASVASKVKVLKWADVEREGIRVEKIISPLPSESRIVLLEPMLRRRGGTQNPVMCLPFRSSPRTRGTYRARN